MQNWEAVIYHTIESLGGEADLQEIYDKLPNFIDLTEGHLKATQWSGRPGYHHIVRSYISNMCRASLLHRTSRGHYKITSYIVDESQS